MLLIFSVIITTVLTHSAEGKNMTNGNTTGPNEEPVALHLLENDVSMETFVSLNTSQKHRRFDIKEMDTTSRRWHFWWYFFFRAKHIYDWELNYRICLMMTNTYLNAIPGIKQYYHKRFLYVNNLDYEVGYLTYEIIAKYQMMIEIYHIMHEKYYMVPTHGGAPTQLLFYMYRHTLEIGVEVHHLCNMLHEVENKYKSAPLGPWDDYPEHGVEAGGKRGDRNASLKDKEALDDYHKRRQEEYKRRQRQRRRDRKYLNIDTRITTPQRRPKKSFWPLHYGWSIEFW